MPAFEIKRFLPSMTYVSPSRRAVVSIAATSDPAFGSVRAKAAIALPFAARESQKSRTCSGAARAIAYVPKPCMTKARSASAEE